MSRFSHRTRVHLRRVAILGVVVVSGVMWRAASQQFTGGVLDLVVFVPPSAALGLMAVWSAHTFRPSRFTWRRGLIGAVVGGLVVSPLIATLVAFAAVWDPASFQFVFNVGAWVALAAGFSIGGVFWTVNWLKRRTKHWRRDRSSRARIQEPQSHEPQWHEPRSHHPSRRELPDASDGIRPTPPRPVSVYDVSHIPRR